MFRCNDCDEEFDRLETQNVHTSYHRYHKKIKNKGKEELKKLEERLNVEIKCPLEDRLEGAYYFPQLPPRLICEWSGCNLEFFSAEDFYDHVSNHAHRNVDKCYWDTCGKVLKHMTVTLLRDHLRVHTLQKLYACPRCGSFFSTKVKFDDHFLRHLELPEFIRNRSPSSVTHHDGELNFNIEVYESSRGKVNVYRCTFDDCDKAFLTSSLLREHSQKHSNRNQCDKCSFIAKSASRLESHKLYRHQDDRNYGCPLCPKTFKQKGDLRAHIRRHQIAGPYKCDKCDFETLNEEGLARHVKQHLDTNEYQCHICKKLISRGNNLSRHLKDLHGIVPPGGRCRFKYKLNHLGYYILDDDASSREADDD